MLIGAAGAGAASFLGLGGTTGQTPVCSTGSAGIGTDIGDGEKLTAEQVANARVIYTTGVSMNIPPYGEAIAIATAIQESRLENLDYGDRDSLGLFQQRPSQGWGTPAQIMNPVYAATRFYQALEQVPNWQKLPLTTAAQDVQESGYPDAYAAWQKVAEQLVATFAGTVGACDLGAGAAYADGLPASFTLPAGTPAQVVTAIDYALAQLGKPYVYGGTGPAGYDCSGLVMGAFLAAGIDLPRTTYQQVHSGTAVASAADLKPGDLIFTVGSEAGASPTNPGHVGIFLGENLVLDSPETGKNIELSEFNGGYWNTQAVAFRRIVPQ
ncbi:C40 family peptidase [Actinospica sp. MGRD01-02]|uniref:C40 family peptidase n=1 Tax=Actinospica acidithermotolerans TaxID=2828514 RepID=A0A941EHT6_9ACTN|nr:C40 family peptidase [Actinospica acidithermotolerans]MBR7830767.1 C40 family peptidase [Actinospica acidithermotolerans]